jgi:outer membrane lipoprotein-sorting protein
VSPEARQAVALLITRWHAFSDLRGLADIVVTRDGRPQRFTGVLLAAAPGSVRFEALSPFGQPLLVATVHEGRLTAYDTSTNEAVVGPADARTTAELLHLPFDPDDLVAVLAGLAVPPKDLRVAEIQPPDEHGPSLLMIGAVHQQRAWMDFATGRVDRLEITGGRAAARLIFSRDAAGTLTGLDVTAGEGLVTGSVRYRNLVVDSGVDAERFTLTLPKDVKTRSIR